MTDFWLELEQPVELRENQPTGEMVMSKYLHI